MQCLPPALQPFLHTSHDATCCSMGELLSSAFPLQRDSSSVQRRRSRDPSYRNSHHSLHFDSCWDPCEGRFPSVGHRMAAVSLFWQASSHLMSNNTVWRSTCPQLCDLCPSEIAATLLSTYWETALAWRLLSICREKTWKKWTSEGRTWRGEILVGHSFFFTALKATSDHFNPAHGQMDKAHCL